MHENGKELIEIEMVWVIVDKQLKNPKKMKDNLDF